MVVLLFYLILWLHYCVLFEFFVVFLVCYSVTASYKQFCDRLLCSL